MNSICVVFRALFRSRTVTGYLLLAAALNVLFLMVNFWSASGCNIDSHRDFA